MSVHVRLAEPKRLPPKEWEPRPAYAGSWSTWAGHAWQSNAPMPTAAFADETKRFVDDEDEGRGADAGSYNPHANTTMEASAAFTFNKKVTAEQQLQQQNPSGAAAALTDGPTPTTLALPQEALELFPLNRYPLRENGAQPTGAAPQSWIDGAKAAGEAAIKALTDASGGGAGPSAAAAATTSTALACTSEELTSLGPYVTAASLKQEREAREAAEKQAKWEARHGGRAKPPKPSPKLGTGNRASDRLAATTTTAKQARDALGSLDRLTAEGGTVPTGVDVTSGVPLSRVNVTYAHEQFARQASPTSPKKPASAPSARQPSARAASARAASPQKVMRRHPSCRNYYAVLKVAPEASEGEIKQAYHKMAKLWHPDRNHDERAERTFKLINRAYQVLGDKKVRRAFDRGENVDAKWGMH